MIVYGLFWMRQHDCCGGNLAGLALTQADAETLQRKLIQGSGAWQNGDHDLSHYRYETREIRVWEPFTDVAPMALPRDPNVPYVEVDQETAYGITTRLSRSIRVF